MTETKKKPTVFTQLLKRKTESQQSGGKFGVLGKELSGQFRKGEAAQPIIRRGGRNPSGKP